MATSPKEIVIRGKGFLDFEIGSDPEFRIKKVKASDFIAFEGEFGTDGPQSQVAELRPKPAFCALNHVKNAQDALKMGWNKYTAVRVQEWLAGSFPDGKPVGGHIHFNSTPKEGMDLKLDALDKLIAPTLLMLEEPGDAQKRRGSEYGQLGTEHRGFSEQPYGGFEYRSPASWIVSKQIASGTLCLAKSVMFEAHNKGLRDNLYKLLRFINKDAKFKSAYKNCDKRYFAPIIPTIYRIVRNLRYIDYHPEYMQYINHLFQLISQGRTWNDKMDLKKRWNIIPNIKQSEKLNPNKQLYTLDEIFTGGLSNTFGLAPQHATHALFMP